MATENNQNNCQYNYYMKIKENIENHESSKLVLIQITLARTLDLLGHGHESTETLWDMLRDRWSCICTTFYGVCSGSCKERVD
jgi:hypothetical protein